MKKLLPSKTILIPDEAELAFKGVIFDVYHWQQEMFDGSFAKFEMLKRSDTTTVICIVDDKVIILDDDQPHRGSQKSLVGGVVDDTDESILSATKREVLEETGYTFSNYKLIKVIQVFQKIEWFVYVYVAWGVVSKQDNKLDAGEKITVNLVSIDKFKEYASNHEGNLGENIELLKNIQSTEDLINLNEFTGTEVDR